MKSLAFGDSFNLQPLFSFWEVEEWGWKFKPSNQDRFPSPNQPPCLGYLGLSKCHLININWCAPKGPDMKNKNTFIALLSGNYKNVGAQCQEQGWKPNTYFLLEITDWDQDTLPQDLAPWHIEAEGHWEKTSSRKGTLIPPGFSAERGSSDRGLPRIQGKGAPSVWSPKGKNVDKLALLRALPCPPYLILRSNSFLGSSFSYVGSWIMQSLH